MWQNDIIRTSKTQQLILYYVERWRVNKIIQCNGSAWVGGVYHVVGLFWLLLVLPHMQDFIWYYTVTSSEHTIFHHKIIIMNIIVNFRWKIPKNTKKLYNFDTVIFQMVEKIKMHCVPSSKVNILSEWSRICKKKINQFDTVYACLVRFVGEIRICSSMTKSWL